MLIRLAADLLAVLPIKANFVLRIPSRHKKKNSNLRARNNLAQLKPNGFSLSQQLHNSLAASSSPRHNKKKGPREFKVCCSFSAERPPRSQLELAAAKVRVKRGAHTQRLIARLTPSSVKPRELGSFEPRSGFVEVFIHTSEHPVSCQSGGDCAPQG